MNTSGILIHTIEPTVILIICVIISFDKYLHWFEDKHHRVLFRGVLHIRDNDHLSERGKELLSRELINCGVNQPLNYCIKKHGVRVLIQGIVFMIPSYMIGALSLFAFASP